MNGPTLTGSMSCDEVVRRRPVARCDVPLNDDLASRRHAMIWVCDVVEVADAGSTNGIVVNGLRVGRCRLRPGDRLMIGDTMMVIELAGRAPLRSTWSTTPSASTARPVGGAVRVGEGPAAGAGGSTGPSNLPVIAAVVPLLMGGVLYASPATWPASPSSSSAR